MLAQLQTTDLLKCVYSPLSGDVRAARGIERSKWCSVLAALGGTKTRLLLEYARIPHAAMTPEPTGELRPARMAGAPTADLIRISTTNFCFSSVILGP